ncbi:17.4 kDa class III heat shock protein, partial [Zea mays]
MTELFDTVVTSLLHLPEVTLEEDRVLVMKGGSGKRKRDEEEDMNGKGCRYIRLERGAARRSFVRKFRLPEDFVGKVDNWWGVAALLWRVRLL